MSGRGWGTRRLRSSALAGRWRDRLSASLVASSSGSARCPPAAAPAGQRWRAVIGMRAAGPGHAPCGRVAQIWIGCWPREPRTPWRANSAIGAAPVGRRRIHGSPVVSAMSFEAATGWNWRPTRIIRRPRTKPAPWQGSSACPPQAPEQGWATAPPHAAKRISPLPQWTARPPASPLCRSPKRGGFPAASSARRSRRRTA